MATKIVTKNSSTASAVPTASDLVQGELAVNVADKRLFTEDNAGAIVELGTNPTTLTVTGEITANGGIALGDGDVATFGDSDDLSIFHAGGTTYLTNTTGSLVLRTDSFRVLNTANSEQILHGDANGAVTAYYDNAVKLATTSTGIDVTGNVTMATGGSIVAGGANDLILNAGESGTPDIYLQSGGSTKVKVEGSNGNVGIGNSSPVELLTIGSTSDTNVRALFLSSTTGAGTIQFGDGTGASAYSGYINYTHSDNALAFATGSAERMRIDSSGRVLVNTTTDIGGARFNVEHTTDCIACNLGPSASGTRYLMYFTYNSVNVGSITGTSTATAYNTSSDQRLKENIADADDAGSKIDAIQVRKYDWKVDGSHQDYGMIAQELQAVAPEAVSVPEDSEEMMGVDYSKLVPMLIKEIQSLRNRVAQLEE